MSTLGTAETLAALALYAQRWNAHPSLRSMGVTIRAESGNGLGTAFRLTLPPARTADSRPPVNAPAPSQLPTRPLG